MTLTEHAERELREAGLFDKDSDYEGMIGEAVMELVKVFSAQGHSGFSANYTLALFTKVAKYGTLNPLKNPMVTGRVHGHRRIQQRRQALLPVDQDLQRVQR